jgi:NAD+ kinase
MKFALIGKLERGLVTKTAHKVYDFLKSKGLEVQVEEEFAKYLGVEGVHWKTMTPDIIVTVGGDGTILKTLENIEGKVFGINAGRYGFLTEVKPEDAIAGLERVIKNDYIIEERQRLGVTLNGSRLYDALNEAVIHTSVIAKMQMFQLRIDGQDVDLIRADGMIVATPTGSTGYSMSAGGPLVDPRVNGFVIVPIAPFKLNTRALMVPSEAKIEIRLLEAKPSVLVLDGQYEKVVNEGDKLEFSVSEKIARFIRFKPAYYDLLRKQFYPERREMEIVTTNEGKRFQESGERGHGHP